MLLLFQNLGISLLLGMLVGLQRERSNALIAGLRTFPLIAVLGTLCAAIDDEIGGNGWIVAAGLLAVAASTLVSHSLQFRSGMSTDPGMTSMVAILLMYGVGAYLVHGERSIAVAVGGGTAVLLQFKPELHGFAERLGDKDIKAIMTFVLITCVVLPVLPNRTYDVPLPLSILNPFEIWLMVVLMVGISLGGYLIYKFVGSRIGVVLIGILGGSISSTATTASFSRRTRYEVSAVPTAALVILIASTVVFGRVLLEISVAAPTLFLQLAPPVAIPLVAGFVAALLHLKRGRTDSHDLPEQKNPTELRSALVFGLLYACVLMALAAVQPSFGERSMYVVALLSGLTDMDAITLSSARLSQLNPADGGIAAATAWRLILVASMSNLVFKALLAASLGHPALRWRMVRMLAVPFVAAGLTLIFWPS